MSYHIVWKNSDETLTLDTLPPECSEQEALAYKNLRIAKQVFIATQFCAIVTSEQLPQDRYYRNAWRFNGSNVVLDVGNCRHRHMEKLRRVRNAKLQDSDADYMRALEQANQTQLAALKNYRQTLRDMPQAVNTTMQAASTPEAIKAIRPAILDTPKP